MITGRAPQGKTKIIKSESQKTKDRKDALGVGLIGLLVFYFGSTFWCCLDAFDGLMQIERALTGYPAFLIANPFPYSFSDPDLLMSSLLWGFVFFMIPWIIWASYMSNRGNYDPGREHGDARWATLEEMDDLRDKKLTSNNIPVTANVSLVLSPRDGQRANETALTNKNHNFYFVGTSGTGKTARVVYPTLIASCGTKLWPNGANREGFFDPGFDTFCTDPKGTIVGNVGHALVNAGKSLRVFNSIDPRRSWHYNPLSYIGTRMVDTLKPEETSWTVEANINNEPIPLSVRKKKIENIRSGKGVSSFTWSGTPQPVDRISQAMEVYSNWICHECANANSAKSAICENKSCTAVRPQAYPCNTRITFTTLLDQQKEKVTPKSVDELKKEWREDECAEELDHIADDVVSTMNYITSKLAYVLEVENCLGQKSSGEITLTLSDHVKIKALNNPHILSEVKTHQDKNGHEVVTWRFSDLDPGEKAVLGVYTEIEKMKVPDGVDLTKQVNALVNGLKEQGGATNDAGDAFWDNSMRLLLMALIAFLFEVYDEKYHSLRWVMYLLNRAKVDMAGTSLSPLDQMFQTWATGLIYIEPEIDKENPFAVSSVGKYCPANPVTLDEIELDDDGNMLPGQDYRGPHDTDNDIALHCYEAYSQGAPETKQSILISCQAAFNRLLNEDMKELLDYDEMELDILGDEGQDSAVFCIGSDTDDTFRFLQALMQYQVINLACDKAILKYNGELPRRLMLVLDEFANTGKQPGFTTTIAVTRSRNIGIMLFLQSITQLDEVYGEAAADIIKENCATYCFLGGQSEKTLEALSKMGGNETVDMWQVSKSFGTSGSTSDQRSAVQRTLISVAQLRLLGADEAIIQVLGLPLFRDVKIYYGAYDFYEWLDPTRPERKRGASKGKRKFKELFDEVRYRNNIANGETPYNLRPELISEPAKWQQPHKKVS